MVLSLHGLEGDLRKYDTTQKTREVILDALEKSPDFTNKELADICGISIDVIKRRGNIAFEHSSKRNEGE